jgi:hypothetical protein
LAYTAAKRRLIVKTLAARICTILLLLVSTGFGQMMNSSNPMQRAGGSARFGPGGQFISGTASFSPPTFALSIVTGAPYSADEIAEQTQTLPDALSQAPLNLTQESVHNSELAGGFGKIPIRRDQCETIAERSCPMESIQSSQRGAEHPDPFASDFVFASLDGDDLINVLCAMPAEH